MRLVTEYLDQTAVRFHDKEAFIDENRTLTFGELQEEAHHIAMALINNGIYHQPIAIFLEKSVECIPAFMGTAYSGNFYSPIDTKMPVNRIEKIMSTFQPAVIITDETHKDDAKKFSGEALVITYEETMKTVISPEQIKRVSDSVIDTDILYVLFTSGSTGMPKGVIISERALVDFTEWGRNRFGIDETYVFGNQAPFYFSFSVLEIYQTIRCGSTTCIIPHKNFSFPALLMQYLYDHKVNTLCWVPSALCMISIFNALEMPYLPEMKNIFFGGEVMPTKQLNKWRSVYKNVRFVNLYGPTEVTDTCTEYEIDREFENTEKLPMGHACRNMDVFLLDEDDNLILDDRIGEVCVRGTGLADGYYNAPDKTAEVFVQNPLNTRYSEKIYKTGDLAMRNSYGELVYISRKDFQIKHMGQRIELGEIEVAISSVEGVDAVCCLHDKEKDQIVMFYTGAVEPQAVIEKVKELVPSYMVPNRRVHLEEMPFNLNGKIDRQKLKEMMEETRKRR